jgi:hypothetical protein
MSLCRRWLGGSLVLTVGLAWTAARADVLFVDLNNAPKEYGACQEGAPGEVHVVGPATSDGKVVDATLIDQKVSELEKAGVKIDTIVISGHDGSGHFFGDYGQFYASELRTLLKNHPRTEKDLTVAALWGCYPTNVHGCETYWLKPTRNIKVAVGFSIRSPSKERPANAAFMKEFCSKRKEAAQAVTKDELCRFYKNLNTIKPMSVAMCNREAEVARDYGPEACYTYQQLYDKCSQFDPGEEQRAMYEKYFAGNEPGFENPPTDGGSGYNGKDGGVSPLRAYYNQLHLWMHCAESLKQERGYDMPYAPTVIRLIFYDQLKKNIARLNAPQLADYDKRMAQLGLPQLALGDIRKLSRGEVNRRIDYAVVALDTAVRNGRSDLIPNLKQALGLQRTLVSLDYRCSHFSLVEPDGRFPSTCIMSYATAARSK